MTLLKDLIKKSDDECSESSDTDFLGENNSSISDTESYKKSTAGTSATQNPTVNSKNRWRKKQICSFDTSFKGEHFPHPLLDSLSPYQYFKIYFTILLNIL